MDMQPGPFKGLMKRVGIVVKVFLSLNLLVMLAAGVFFGLTLLSDLYETVSMRLQWQPTPCQITASEATQESGKYVFKVKYTCKLDSKTYSFDRYRNSYYGSDDFAKAQALADRYPVGSEVTCYVSPDEPYQAVLKHDSLGTVPFTLVSLGFVAIALGMFYTLWWGEEWGTKRAEREEKEETERNIPLSSPPKAGRATWIGLVAGGVFFLIGLAILLTMFLIPIYRILNAVNWEETPCEIISSDVRIEQDSDGTSYSVDVYYRYTFQGTEYRSNRYSFFGNLSGGSRGQQKIVDRYPEGSADGKHPNAVCYVDPDDPQNAVLDRGINVDLAFVLFPLAFIAIGGFVFFGILTGILKPVLPAGKWTPRQVRDMISSRRAPVHPATLHSLPSAAPPEEITLKPEGSPFGCLLLLFVVGLICSGLASGCVWGFVRMLQRGNSDFIEIMSTITMATVTGLPGMACLLLLFSGIHAMLVNPKPVMTVSRAALPIGESFELHWTVEGQASRVRHFTIQLIGREEVTFRVGTSISTDEHDFRTIDIFESSDPFTIAEGSARVTVPSGTMHSFESDNNKIIWLLKVKGDMGGTRWLPHITQIDQEYRITVLPLPTPGERL